MTTITIHEKIGLAQCFSAQLGEALTVHQLQQVNRLNEEDGPHSPVCHSHDFCDANMFMLAAWEEMLGSGTPDLNDDANNELWADAWAIAKAAGFWL